LNNRLPDKFQNGLRQWSPKSAQTNATHPFAADLDGDDDFSLICFVITASFEAANHCLVHFNVATQFLSVGTNHRASKFL